MFRWTEATINERAPSRHRFSRRPGEWLPLAADPPGASPPRGEGLRSRDVDPSVPRRCRIALRGPTFRVWAYMA